MINKYKKEIEELKQQLNEYENYFNDEEKNKYKRISENNQLKKIINELEEENKELKEDKNNDDYDDMPYLETEEEAAERIVDFHEKKGKGYVDLSILLSKLNINSSKELISNVKQLINDLYDNEQITKQVYNILNRALTYKNDS